MKTSEPQLTPKKKFDVNETVQTPVGLLPVLDIAPIYHADGSTEWLYIFGEDHDEKFTEEELLEAQNPSAMVK